MTLNITVLTKKCIYQSADYRLTDLQKNATRDFQTQKIFVVNTFSWSATVCFTGVGRTRDMNVHEWLSDQLGALRSDDTFEHLIERLLGAETWLSRIPTPYNKHSFSVGAFVGHRPVFALVSNFERPSGKKFAAATRRLSVFRVRVNRPKVIVPGLTAAVTRVERMRLIASAAQNSDPIHMHAILAQVNRSAASRISNISPACFTTHLRITGEGYARAHDVGNALLPHPVAMPAKMHDVMNQFLDKQYGHKRWRLDATSFSRSGATDEYHQVQLQEKPGSASAHSNYGLFLQSQKGDLESAERQYRRAIELDPNHVHALGNLANLVSGRGDLDQAASLYRKALESDPNAENVIHNFAYFLATKLDDPATARDLVDRGILANPKSGRLLLLRGRFNLEDGNSLGALEAFRQARETRVDQGKAEAGYAFALHLSGAPVGECIAAYHAAMALNPEVGALRVNLAQLLFLQGEEREAIRNLDDSVRLGLDDSGQLEALFYRLCHITSGAADHLHAMQALFDRGARLNWNVQPNIEAVRMEQPEKALLLEEILKAFLGEEGQRSLLEIASSWPSSDS